MPTFFRMLRLRMPAAIAVLTAYCMLVGSVVLGEIISSNGIDNSRRDTAGSMIAMENTADSSAIGHDEEEPFEIEGIVVTATRSEKRPVEIPAVTSVRLPGDVFRYKTPSDLPELLSDISGIRIQKTSRGQGSPFIRGFTGFRNLLLIDGIRLNNSVFRDGPNQYWSTVDQFLIRRLEAVKGTGSVLYGSDAIGGAVNLLTRTGPVPRERTTLDILTHYRYASADNSSMGRLELSGATNGRLSWAAGLSLKKFGELRGGSVTGRQARTDFDEYAADAVMSYYFGPRSKAVLAFQATDQDDIWRTHKTVYGISWQGTEVGNEKKRCLDQKRRLVYLQYRGIGPLSWLNWMSASLSYHCQEELQERLRGDGRSDNQGFDIGSLGIWMNLETSSPAGDFTYGVDFYHDLVNSFRNNFDEEGNLSSRGIQGPIADDSRYSSLGLFIQDDIAAGPRINFIVGLRYSYFDMHAGRIADPQDGSPFSLSRGWRELTGSFRTVWHMDHSRRWNIFAGIAQGFRAPNLSDLTRFDAARSHEIEIPAADLKPERYLSYEVGTKIIDGMMKTEAVLFYTDIRDLIIRTPTGDIIDNEYVVTKKNSGQGYMSGFEVSSSIRPDEHLTAFGSFYAEYGECDVYAVDSANPDREPIDRLSPVSGRLGLRWQGADNGYWFEGVAVFAGRQKELSTRDKADSQRIPPGGTPAYSVLTIRGGFILFDRMNISVTLENITDEDYRIHGSGLNEPGRSFILALTYGL